MRDNLKVVLFSVVLILLIVMGISLMFVDFFTTLSLVARTILLVVGSVISFWGSVLIVIRLVEIYGEVNNFVLELLLMVGSCLIFIGIPFISTVGLLVILFGG